MDRTEIEKIEIESARFLDALSDAEQAGEKEFTCPLCGGKASWGKSSYNGHIHAYCEYCGFTITQ